MHNTINIGVLGAGSWGTALAIHLARNNHKVVLWGRNKSRMQSIQEKNCNEYYLPNIDFPADLTTTADLKTVACDKDLILIAVPSKAFVETLQNVVKYVNNKAYLLWATKGLDTTGRFLEYSVNKTWKSDYGIISGPSFAAEVANNLPTAVTIASSSTKLTTYLIKIFTSDTFRTYGSKDLIGVQYGGLIKNILAVAAGISDGLGYGANARAALLTRGMAEVTHLGLSLGADRNTLMGLSGFGDLILSCTDNQSRNRRFGLEIGKGMSIQQANNSIGQVVEAICNVQEVFKLAVKNNITIPIITKVHDILIGKTEPAAAVRDLLQRPWTWE